MEDIKHRPGWMGRGRDCRQYKQVRSDKNSRALPPPVLPRLRYFIAFLSLFAPNMGHTYTRGFVGYSGQGFGLVQTGLACPVLPVSAVDICTDDERAAVGCCCFCFCFQTRKVGSCDGDKAVYLLKAGTQWFAYAPFPCSGIPAVYSFC